MARTTGILERTSRHIASQPSPSAPTTSMAAATCGELGSVMGATLLPMRGQLLILRNHIHTLLTALLGTTKWTVLDGLKAQQPGGGFLVF